MPLKRAIGQIAQNAGADTSVSEGTQVTSGGSANTKGSYVQLTSSTSYHAGGMIVVLGGAPSGSKSFLVDIAVGGSGSEQVIIPNIFFWCANDSSIGHAYIPIDVPAGSRISARSACDNASTYIRVNTVLVSGEFTKNSAVSYGVDSANSRGTLVTGNNTSNTKGSWAQLVSATTQSHEWAIVCVRAQGNSQYLLDIGVGGAGSEQVLIPSLNVRDSSTGQAQIFCCPVRIPEGSRVAARVAAANGNTSCYISVVMI